MTADIPQALERFREGFGEHVISPHRVADLDRAAGEPVDLGGLADQATPALDIDPAKP